MSKLEEIFQAKLRLYVDFDKLARLYYAMLAKESPGVNLRALKAQIKALSVVLADNGYKIIKMPKLEKDGNVIKIKK